MAIDFANLNITSPKRTRRGQTGWEGFFPYYAGYPESFAVEVLSSAGLTKTSRVFDPWNGSGTTTFAASKLLLESTGIDINPVMAIVARARTLPPSEADSLVPLSRHLLDKSHREPVTLSPTDPLNGWFGPLTAAWLRSLERAISGALTSEMTRTNGHIHAVSAIAATYYVALFALCRELAISFQSSNPTWLKTAKDGQRRASAPRTWLPERFEILVAEMAAALAMRDSEFSEVGAVELLVGDTAGGIAMQSKVDLVLTSPPYCTRIDYTAATRIQLAVLAPLLTIEKNELSRQMLGSVRVPAAPVPASAEWGETCNSFLQAVRTHPSKASAGYYYRTHADYFSKMFRSIGAISRVMKDGAGAVLVIQDSYYKEIHNDLPLIVTEMATKHGLRLRRQENFRLTKTLAGSHPHTKNYRTSFEANEAVLCFERT